MESTASPKYDGFEEDFQVVVQRGREEKRVLRGLLDETRGKKDHFLAVSARMGDSHSYITSVPLRWLADVRFAFELDVFDDYRKDGKRVDINKETVDLLTQRQPDWRRQLPMTAYLATRKHHKFPPVLLVAYQSWIFDPDSDQWGVDKRASKDSITHTSLDSKNEVVDLDHSGTQFYALDGQHRLMSVKGLRDLLDGNLYQKKKDGSLGRSSISIGDVMQHAKERDENAFKQELLSIMDETIGVEIIPAVQEGETRKEASMRLRQIFVDVNQNTRRLEKGELALLDETDGFRIVAREVMVLHPLFSRSNELLVDTKSNQLNEKSESYTTLQTIVNMTKWYLGQMDGFDAWENYICDKKEAGLLRPTDEELEKGRLKMEDYFDALMSLPSHKEMIQGESVSKIRSHAEGCGDNILFRPMAQEALAKAVGDLERERDMEPKAVIEKLNRHDNRGKPDLKLTVPASPFFGVLCEPSTKKMRRQASYRDLAAQMFVYLLGGGFSEAEDRDLLRKQVAESRRTTPEGSRNPQGIDYDGESVDLDKIELPPPW